MKKWLITLRLRLFSFFNGGVLVFDKKYREIVRQTRKLFSPFYKLHSESLKELLRVKDELIQEFKKDYDKDFNEVILLLLSRSIQNLESIFILTERSLYGSAFGLLRNILSDMNMFYYLHYNPNLIPIFIKETQASYQEDPNFRSQFNEGTIDKDLRKRGVKSINKELKILSKTMHARVWGTQLYGTEGRWKNDRGQFHAKYGPGFETKKTLGLFSVILSAHWDYLCMILDHRHARGLDIRSEFWKSTIRRVYALEPKILSLSSLGENALVKMDLKRKGIIPDRDAL